MGALDWRVQMTVRRDGVRAALAFTAPIDALFAATLINEWAWMRAATDRASINATVTAANEVPPEPESPDDPLPPNLPDALARLRVLIAEEANPALVSLMDRAATEGVPFMADEDFVSVGYGIKSATWPARALPAPDAVDWKSLGAIPVALVTGSNGKTTTTRLVAAMLANAGHTVGFCCSDGVFIAGAQVESGDWSGPSGAKRVLRDPRVTAAVLETARGGLLRRGLVVPQADAAIITNIAEDHFGGYGIHSLADLAAAKFVVERALGGTGTLVLSGDDTTLRAAHQAAHSAADTRARGANAHGASSRVEWFSASAPPASVPAAAEMPIAFGGAAAYNVMNAIGAAHVASALGVTAEVITQTLREFGSDNADNPGRLERRDVRGVRVWIDYAHNPHGLAALLDLCNVEAHAGRIGLLLGQAGDRDDDALRALARTAWVPRPRLPDRIALKDVDGYLRGRAPGAVPELMRAELIAAGAPADRLSVALDELSGVRALLDWARPGDLLVLPVHNLEARKRTIALLETLRGS